jgi:uncharacterized protein (DUF362 family)
VKILPVSRKTKVIVKTTTAEGDSDRFDVTMDVLGKAGFWEVLESKWKASRKSKEDFSIAIKPNIMMFYSKKDMAVITDPTLVEFLIDEIYEKGFTNIAVVESQNVFGNWFKNRDVLTVAKAAGYHDNRNYRIVDITKEKIPHNYPGKLGNHWVGPTWRDADFRISFAKNKTHFSCYYTLTIKNIYGTTPLQNKFLEYHKKREITWATIEMIKEFPIHFGIIDAIWGSDGVLGIKADWTPKNTKRIIAGENFIAVAWVGAELMGLDPTRSVFMQEAVNEFGIPDIEKIGDLSLYPDWDNIPKHIDKILNLGEEWYSFSNLLGFISSDMDPMFPVKMRWKIFLGIRRITIAILNWISKHE